MKLNRKGKLIFFVISFIIYLISVALFVFPLSHKQEGDIFFWLLLYLSSIVFAMGIIHIISLIYQSGFLWTLFVVVGSLFLSFALLYIGIKLRFAYHHYLLSAEGKFTPCQLDSCERFTDIKGEEYLSCSYYYYVEADNINLLGHVNLPGSFRKSGIKVECKYYPENPEIVELYIDGKFYDEKFRISKVPSKNPTP